jgi:putative sterol carrier protein
VTHPFLSDEWITAARAIRARYADQVPPMTATVGVNLTVLEVPFTSDVLHAHMDTSSGTLELELGHLDAADAHVTLDYATARAMLVERDPALVMQAVMSGRVQIEGDLMKVMALQASMPADEVSLAVADEIVAITDLA